MTHTHTGYNRCRQGGRVEVVSPAVRSSWRESGRPPDPVRVLPLPFVASLRSSLLSLLCCLRWCVRVCVMGAGVCLCLCVRGEGRTIWVDGERGDNSKTGSETEPVKTIGKGVSLAVAGDEVVVKAGKYWKVEFSSGREYGKEGQVLVVRSEEKGKAVVVGGIEVGAGEYVVVEGFEVVGEGVKVAGRHNEP